MTLDQFVDEGIKKGSARGCHPNVFLGMRRTYGTIGAIERIVKNGQPHSGFLKMRELDLLDWTLEAAVLKFPEHFTSDAKIYAQARLEGKLDA